MLRTINHVNLADRAAIAVLRAVPAASRGIIPDHQPCLTHSDGRRASTEGPTFDLDRNGALSNSLHGV
jgi:hypothetical protein